MSDHWQDAYADLRGLIATHAEIKIEKSRVSIPASIRAEYYSRFDMVRDAFVQEHYPTLPVEMVTLADNYREVEREILDRLDLERVTMPASLDTLLHNPRQGLASALFDPVFKLLQGQVDPAAFEEQALIALDIAITDLCRCGYPYWVALSILRALEPDQTWQVALDAEGKPFPKELHDIPFGCPAPHPTLRFPDFLVHSSRVSQYIALKLELASEINTYTTDSRWERKQAIRNGGRTCTGFGPRVLLLYVQAQPEDIPLVADLDTRLVTPPQVVVECGWQQEHVWQEAVLRHRIIEPKEGTYLVLHEPPSEINRGTNGENLFPLQVSCCASQLEPILTALASGMPRQEMGYV